MLPLSCLLVWLVKNKLCNCPLLAPVRHGCAACEHAWIYIRARLCFFNQRGRTDWLFPSCGLNQISRAVSFIQEEQLKSCSDSSANGEPRAVVKIEARPPFVCEFVCSPFWTLRHSSVKCTLAFSDNAVHVVECLWSGPPCRCVCVFHFEYVPQPPFAVCRISFFSYWPAYFLAMYVFYLYLFVCALMRTLY